MNQIADVTAASRQAWGAEVRATLSLAWPLIVTNLSQTAMTTTDIVFIGRLGADSLAAAALGTNLYFAFLIVGIGIASATAPLIASEVGRNRFSVRDVRRTFRQAMWTAIAVSIPMWAILWQAEAIMLFLGQEPALARAAAGYVHTLQWAILPFLFYVVIRSLISAMERPLAAFWIGLAGVVVNALAGWALILGHFGFPRLGLAGAGIATTFSTTALFRRPGAVPRQRPALPPLPFLRSLLAAGLGPLSRGVASRPADRRRRSASRSPSSTRRPSSWA